MAQPPICWNFALEARELLSEIIEGVIESGYLHVKKEPWPTCYQCGRSGPIRPLGTRPDCDWICCRCDESE